MGLLQGVTELFPVSSLGHGVLVPAYFGWTNLVNSQSQGESFFLAFIVALHVGTAIGLIVFYRATWVRLFRGLARQAKVARESGLGQLLAFDDASMDRDYRLLVLVAIGTVPVGLVGLIFEHKLRTLFAKPLEAAIFLTINGVILLGGEYLRRRAPRGAHAAGQKLETLTPTSALTVGSSQIAALFAGISRSGVAMVAGLLRGLSHEDAAEFSFLLATPVILLAGLYKIPDLLGPLGDGIRTQALVGSIFAAFAAYFSVRFLTRWFHARTLLPFGIYSAVVGIISIVHFA
jgi:undecaprenyl-diphosphatase